MRATRLIPSLLYLTVRASTAAAANLPLFQPWNLSDWTASDDTVRGGQSQSNLEILASSDDNESSILRFYGTLDYEALNGSGFASQRTVDDWPGLDLSAYDRIVLDIPYTDGKTYSLNLKDTVPPTVDGVEQAGMSWEHDFQLPAYNGTASGSYEQVEIMFADLVPTYRGRVQNDTAPLNLADIKRVNLMIRR